MNAILQTVSAYIDPRDIRDYGIIAVMLGTSFLPDAVFFAVYRMFAVLVGGIVLVGIATG